MTAIQRLNTGRSAQFSDSGGGNTSGWTLIEEHIAVADETSHTFTGLDGDTDNVYFLDWGIAKATTANNEIDLQPNGISINLTWQGFGNANGAAPTGLGTLTRWLLNQNNSGAGNEPMCGSLTLWARRNLSGAGRFFRATTLDYEGPTGMFARETSGKWTDSTTNLTSLVVLSTVTNGIKAGSTISLWKRSG